MGTRRAAGRSQAGQASGGEKEREPQQSPGQEPSARSLGRSQPRGANAASVAGGAEELEERLRKAPPPPALLLVGPDEDAKERLIDEVEQAIQSAQGPEVSRVTTTGEEASAQRLLEELWTSSLFGGARLVVVRRADRMAAGEARALAEGIRGLAEGSYLVLTASALPGRSEAAGGAGSRQESGKGVAPEIAAAVGPEQTYHLGILPPDQLAQRCIQQAAAEGVALEADAARWVVVASGGDPLQARVEVAKLVTFAGPGGRVTAGDARRLCSLPAGEIPREPGEQLGRRQGGIGGHSEYQVYDFVDAVASGRLAEALDHLQRLLERGEPPLVLLAVIASRFRLIQQVGEGLAREPAAAGRGPEADAARERLARSIDPKFNPKRLYFLLPQARQNPPARCRKALEWVLQTDRLLKTTELDPEVALHQLVCRLAGR